MTTPEARTAEDRSRPSGIAAAAAPAQPGAALVVAMLVIVLALGTTFAGAAILKANKTRTDTAFLLDGQALQLADAGITEAINWLRRQPAQPVTVFAPVLDTTATPDVLDTDDPDVGLARDFAITGKFWGRYEVWKRWDADPDPVRLATRQRLQARDVSSARGKPAAGSTWLIRSIGYVYERNDANTPYDQRPNRVLASEVLETEVSRFGLALPGNAAVITGMGGPMVVQNGANALGGATGAGIYYATGNGTPTINGNVLGTPQTAAAAGVFDSSLEAMMGLGEDELKGMADQIVSRARDFPDFIAESSIIYVDSNSLILDSSKPLRGVGILYCEGNMTVQAGGVTNFSGLIIVRGQINITGPGYVRGALLGDRGITLSGGADQLTVEFSERALKQAMDTLGSYRISRPVRSVRSGG